MKSDLLMDSKVSTPGTNTEESLHFQLHGHIRAWTKTQVTKDLFLLCMKGTGSFLDIQAFSLETVKYSRLLISTIPLSKLGRHAVGAPQSYS